MGPASAIRRWGLGLAACALLVVGCAGDQPPPRPTTQEIQEDSDRFFQELRLEEEERGVAPGRAQ